MLTKAHRQVEGSHRTAAWRVVLDLVPETARARVIGQMEATLCAWLRYRDAVANACGIGRGEAGAPVLIAG